MKVTEAAVNWLVQKWFRRLMLSDLWTIKIKINHQSDNVSDEDREDEASVTITDGYDHAELVINAFRIQTAASSSPSRMR